MMQALRLAALVVVCLIIAFMTAIGQVGLIEGITTLIPCILVVVALGLQRLGQRQV